MTYDPLVDDLSRAYLDEGALPPQILRELHEAKVAAGMRTDAEAALAAAVNQDEGDERL